jgi:molybdate transport system substrate-binding protein
VRALLAILVISAASVGDAAEIKVLSGNGARAAVRELSGQFERASGHRVSIRFEVNAVLKEKIEAGETFDVAVLNPPVLDGLIAGGKIVPGSRAVIGRIGIGAAVRAGAPRPAVSTVAGFKRTLLNAKAVAFPGQGASGIYFTHLVERLGIGEEMRAKLRPMPAEDAVEVVARGEADLVVVVASRIFDVPGVDFVGLLAPELQTTIGFAAGVGSAAAEPDAARDMIAFLTGPHAIPTLKAMGIEPGQN